MYCSSSKSQAFPPVISTTASSYLLLARDSNALACSVTLSTSKPSSSKNVLMTVPCSGTESTIKADLSGVMPIPKLHDVLLTNMQRQSTRGNRRGHGWQISVHYD